MNSQHFSLETFTQILANQFNGLETEVRIHIGLKNLLDFVCTKNNIIYGAEQVELLIEHCGLKKLLRGISEQKKEQLIRSVEQFILYNFFRRISLNFGIEGCPFKVEKLDFCTGDLTTGNSTSVGYTAGVSGANTWTVEKNFRKKPTFEIMYETGHRLVDEFSLASLYLNHYFSKMNTLTEFQRMQIWQLTNFVSNRGAGLTRLLSSQKDSKFLVNNQHVLMDYVVALLANNIKIREALKLQDFVPYMLELNGVPGVGKSTFVSLLSKIMTEIFPFIQSENMVYCRVNDKFWNGYHQQPIVLFDDSNQNEKLLYNLDNEIIAIGSGQFVHPPMAFEKETIFGSSFVIFTTNERLVNTTRVNQGAVARRLHTVSVEPKSHLGEMTVTGDFVSRWSYRKGVKQNAFNLTFDSNSPNYIVNSFLAKLYNQIGTQTLTNSPLEDIFNEFEEVIEEPTLAQELVDFSAEIESKRQTRESVKQTLSESEKFEMINVNFDVENENIHKLDKVRTAESSVLSVGMKRKTDSEEIHKSLNAIYNANTQKEMFGNDSTKTYSYTLANWNLKVNQNYICFEIRNHGIISKFACCASGNYEQNYVEKKQLSNFGKIIKGMYVKIIKLQS